MHTNNPYFIDTNALKVLLFDELLDLDKNELEFRKKVEEIQITNGYYITDFIISEFLTVIQKVFPKKYNIIQSDLEFSVELVKLFINKNLGKSIYFITPDVANLEKYLDIYPFKKSGISFTDYLLICMSKEYNCEVLSMDKKLNIAKGAYFSG